LQFVEKQRAEAVRLKGVLLYGLARPSMQTEAPRLSPLPPAWMASFAAEIEALGIAVKVSL
ncbi:MAG TPA: radical SAM protein, partial [Betaproteobacteria bacterium]|nr:radical SAM protein [Betaproteobacteria bacterium]